LKGKEMAGKEKTSKRVGKITSQQLRSKRTSKKAKSTAASALTHRPDRKKRISESVFCVKYIFKLFTELSL